MPSFIPKLAKIAVFGAKMDHFRPQNESEVSETVFFFDGLKSWWSRPSFIHFGYWKSIERNTLIYPKISQNRSFWGKNGPFLAPKWVRSVRNYFHLLQHEKLVQYPKFHPFWWSLSMVSTLIPHCTWQVAPPFVQPTFFLFLTCRKVNKDNTQCP